MPTGTPQKQRRLITRLKNIRKFFIKNMKIGTFYGTAISSCSNIIRYEKDKLKQMKQGRRKK